MTTTPLHTRAESGLRPANIAAPITSEGVTGHYGGPSPWGSGADRSSSAAFRDSTNHDRCASIWRAWQAFHMDARGWTDIAYNSGVCPHGHRYDGRGVGRRSAANGTNTGNARSEAVVYIAGDGDPLTDEAKLAFLDEGSRMAGGSLRWDHSDWKATECAGGPFRTWEADRFRSPVPAPIDPAPPVLPPPPPSSSAPPFPGRLLRYPPIMRGADVRQWQARMRDRGWKITVDGAYGPGSVDVCRRFQREKRLTVDGVVGPATWRAAWTAPVTG